MKKLILFLILLLPLNVYAEEKIWATEGAGFWEDTLNWSPQDTPVAGDDVYIDTENASVSVDENFQAQSLILGGRNSSDLVFESFVFGTFTPVTSGDDAIFNRRDGYIILRGSGVITLKGQYKSTEAPLSPEPSFMFWAE